MYVNINSHSRLSFELEQFDFQLKNLINSKTQRECILNSNELCRILENSPYLERAASIILDPNKLQQSTINTTNANSIKEMIPVHHEIALFITQNINCEWQGVDAIHSNFLHLKQPIDIKYWTLYKLILILECDRQLGSIIYLKQFVSDENGIKQYIISPFYIKLLSKRIENQRNGITDKTEEVILLEEKALNEMQINYVELRKHFEKNKPQDYTTTMLIERFPYANKDGIETSDGFAGGLYSGIRIALNSIAKNANKDSLDFVNKFAEVDSKGNITKFTFSPSYDEYERERLRIEQTQGYDFEASWNYVVFPYVLLKDGEKTVKTYLEDGKGLSAFACNSIHNDLTNLINSKNDTISNSKYMDVVETKLHWTRISEGIKKLAQQEKEALERERFFDSRFYREKLTLRVQSIDLQFKDDGDRGEVMKDIFEARNGLPIASDDGLSTKKWFYDELHEDITKESATKETMADINSRWYEACRGINKRIEKETGIKDFLIVMKKSVQINPKYFYKEQDNQQQANLA